MQIKLPKIIRQLKIAEYAEEAQEEIQVWVNPPAKLLQEYDQTIAQVGEILKRAAEKRASDEKPAAEDTAVEPAKSGDSTEVKTPDAENALQKELEDVGKRQIEILSELWSQGSKDTHYSVEDIKELIAGTRDTDPGFWLWLKNKTIFLIVEHRVATKKG